MGAGSLWGNRGGREGGQEGKAEGRMGRCTSNADEAAARVPNPASWCKCSRSVCPCVVRVHEVHQHAPDRDVGERDVHVFDVKQLGDRAETIQDHTLVWVCVRCGVC